MPLRPGDSVYVHGGRISEFVLGEELSSSRTASVFRLEGVEGQLAKLFHDAKRRPELRLLGSHLRRTLGPSATPREDSPNVARPTYELYAGPRKRTLVAGKEEPVGFLMHEFAASRGWMTLDAAGQTDLGQSAEWCLAVARQLAHDVAYFATTGLIVGDLSDANILVDRHAAVAWIDVDSFGAEPTGDLERVVTIGGTPECRAPELIHDEGIACSRQTDAFALALQVVRLLTCQFDHPFAIKRVSGNGGAETVDDRVGAYESWMVEPGAFNVATIGHPGCGAWPADLADLTRRAFTRGSDRPIAAEWYRVLSAIAPEDLAVESPSRPPRGRPAPDAVHGPNVMWPPPDLLDEEDDEREDEPAKDSRLTRRLVLAAILVAAVIGSYLLSRHLGDHAASGRTLRDGAALDYASPRDEAPPVLTASEHSLVKILPAGVEDCVPVRMVEAGAQAALRCQRSGLRSIEYTRFASVGAMNRWLRARVASTEATSTTKRICESASATTSTWRFTAHEENAGRYLCWTTPNLSHIEWTVTARRLYVDAASTDDIAVLWKLWNSGALE
ncbi:hypothetical protein [Baekduia sp.]|uniref:hypothetical protein n=1 Tax=Baekduia sp. TaxID=2600305 RepID=UPI002DF7A639|nr:hypothetical protein [Baekduia sp.]